MREGEDSAIFSRGHGEAKMRASWRVEREELLKMNERLLQTEEDTRRVAHVIFLRARAR